jgi:hypothetical protein
MKTKQNNMELTDRQKELVLETIKEEGGPHSAVGFYLKTAILSYHTVMVDIDNTLVDIDDMIDYIETIRCIQRKSMEEEIEHFKARHYI